MTREEKALQLVETGEQRPYTTTLDTCTCPDYVYRHNVCKHILALRIQAQPPARPVQTNPLEVDGFAITRLDFFVQEDGNVIVQRLAQTPFSNGRHVVLVDETKPVDLDAAETWLRRNGFTTRRWPATAGRPAGMRAWHADEPWPIRTEGQIRKLRAQLGQLGHSLNLAFDF